MSYYNGQGGAPSYDPQEPLKEKDAPPSYYGSAAPDYNATALPPAGAYGNPAQPQASVPYQESPPPQGISMSLRTTTTTTTTGPKHQSPIPNYPYLAGVVDIVPPTYMVSPISRDILANAQIMTYSRDVYDSDDAKTSSPTCCDMTLALLGLFGLALVAIFVVVTLLAGIGPQLVAVVFAAPLLIAYLAIFMCCTYICCGCCDASKDQYCLSAPYYTAVFRGHESSSETIKRSIEHLSRDVPQLSFHVTASHQTGSGKNRRTVITYSQAHTIPILHAKFVGAEANQFLSALDDFVSGDVAIQYIPRLVLHPQQHDYILRFKEMVYQCNKHRDTTVTVVPYIKCYDPSGATPEVTSGFMVEEVRFPDPSKTIAEEDVEMMYAGDSDREPAFRRKQIPDESTMSSMQLRLATSLGNRTDIYQSNGHSSNAVLKCLTSGCCWVFGVLTCTVSFLMCCWHARFTGARYHATFHVLFPRYEDLSGTYNNNMEQFYVKPPQIQPQQMPLGAL